MLGVRSVGDWIGERFEIFDVHQGGMSLVYVVNDHLGPPGRSVVALKTLKDELLTHRIRRSRFAAECRLWVQLGHHTNIVQAYSVEILDGKPYVVLELVQGGDLIRWIGSPRLDLVQALRFGVQFCHGMEHALRQGLHCHRDVKPGNLLITEDGTLKITDFGLARVCEEMIAVRPELPDGSIPLDEPASPQRITWTDPRDQPTKPLGSRLRSDVPPPPAGGPGQRSGAIPAPAVGFASRSVPSALSSSSLVNGDGDRSAGPDRRIASPDQIETEDYTAPPLPEGESQRLTRSGARLGTGPYMAPEQFRDPSSVDVRADIYGFGVVLFEMVTGELPFKGKSIDMLDRQHSRYDPPSVVPVVARRHSARIAKEIDQIVQRCLKKDPGERFHTMTELRRALTGLLTRLGAR